MWSKRFPKKPYFGCFVIQQQNQEKHDSLLEFPRTFFFPERGILVTCDICEKTYFVSQEQDWEFTDLGVEVEMEMPIIGICCTDYEACRARAKAAAAWEEKL